MCGCLPYSAVLCALETVSERVMTSSKANCKAADPALSSLLQDRTEAHWQGHCGWGKLTLPCLCSLCSGAGRGLQAPGLS